MRQVAKYYVLSPKTPPFTPLDLSPALWLDASDTATITASGGSVSQWDDKSGNGRHVTQGTAAAQPTTAAATQNGLNVLSFDGGDRLAAATASDWTFLHDGSVSTWWMVVKIGNAADPNAFYNLMQTMQTAGTVGLGINLFYDDRLVTLRNDCLIYQIGNSTDQVVFNVSANDAFIANTWGSIRVFSDADASPASARSLVAVNDGAGFANNAATNAPSAVSSTRALTIAGANGSLVGQIAEVIIANGALTAQQVTDTETYLAAKWGL